MERTVIKTRSCDIPVVRIEASKLLLTNDFMQFVPWNEDQRRLKDRLTKIISKGMKDFYKPIYDPSFNRYGEITFVEGKTPAIGKSFSWWEEAAQKIAPEYRSRIGTDEEYIAFIGVMIKALSRYPNRQEDIWRAFCDDSKEYGHYWNSPDSSEDFEKTGRREICGVFDLANTFKAMKSSDGNPGYCIASGSFVKDGKEFPIARIGHRIRNNALGQGVGWIVFDAQKGM